MRERTIERSLVTHVKQLGGMALKFVSPGLAGVPDRLVLLPGGRCAFVELKATGKTLRPLQAFRQKQLEAMGFPYYVVDSMDAVDAVIHKMGGDAT